MEFTKYTQDIHIVIHIFQMSLYRFNIETLKFLVDLNMMDIKIVEWPVLIKYSLKHKFKWKKLQKS